MSIQRRRITNIAAKFAFPKEDFIGKIGTVLSSFPAVGGGRIFYLKFDDPVIRQHERTGKLYFWDNETEAVASTP